MRRAAALGLAALALSGCETTSEKSARLERAALAARAKRGPAGPSGAKITRQSTKLHVKGTVLLRGSEGYAVAVTVSNDSTTAQLGAPIEVSIVGAGGHSRLYSNAEGGVAQSLVSLPLIAAHQTITWVDDQIQLAGSPGGAAVTAKLGEGTRVKRHGASPAVEGQQLAFEPGGIEAVSGKVVNHGTASQRELVVFAVARRGGEVVAAGRAVVASLAPGTASAYQIFLTGSAKGARLELEAPPTVAR